MDKFIYQQLPMLEDQIINNRLHDRLINLIKSSNINYPLLNEPSLIQQPTQFNRLNNLNQLKRDLMKAKRFESVKSSSNYDDEFKNYLKKSNDFVNKNSKTNDLDEYQDISA